jgi:hypothetical protein
MFFFTTWIRDWLGVNDLQKRVDQLEAKMAVIDNLVTKSLDSFGQYSSRSTEELQLIKTNIDNRIDTLNNMMTAIDDQAHIKRAKQLLQRLRNNRSRDYSTRPKPAG